MNIDNIKNKLINPNSYAIMPIASKDIPVLLPEWEIQDADGNNTGEFYSAQTLSDALGKLLVLVPKVDGNYFLMRYGFDWDTIPQVIGYFKALGLTDFRENADGTLKTASEVDYILLDGTSFSVVPPHMVKDIPTTTIIEEIL